MNSEPAAITPAFEAALAPGSTALKLMQAMTRLRARLRSEAPLDADECGVLLRAAKIMDRLADAEG